ncbi:permease [Prochlorococcus marinus str. MU1404]|uniref:sulfite exporter TauE/SafE family protein n=1 Tax=Prochlorococcus marinus TaxID=1219 RepID=UPI001ADCB321|nr:sulfite exporter TauE/SafE family protein [Prochlorococcus marinus]MBO8230209.1 sulfite exporter TauE/SafE family protein [Prochlorococcus marinus XMU1404]MBW3073019.1 permease [Prochlorococcus marinus str. MU1404]MCR8545454.1 sulfite exporter TauE/SafE family protein [Prochlorococcus marinus CUG1432]
MLHLLTTLVNSFDYSFYKSIYIFFLSFFSNTFSAISGGGAGLIQLPALILFGVPYYQALASHKLATVALGLGGSLRNYKSLKNDIFIAWQVLIFGLPGVIFGASFVEFISEQYLYLLLGLISIFLAFYSFFRSDLGLSSGSNKLNLIYKIRFLFFIFLIGILNGSISSGTGLLVTILLIKTYGMDFLRAISLTFFTVGIFWNFTGAVFLSKIGPVNSNLIIFLIVGSFTGGYLGAHLSKLKGNTLVKKTFTLVCLLVGITLLMKSIVGFL